MQCEDFSKDVSSALVQLNPQHIASSVMPNSKCTFFFAASEHRHRNLKLMNMILGTKDEINRRQSFYQKGRPVVHPTLNPFLLTPSANLDALNVSADQYCIVKGSSGYLKVCKARPVFADGFLKH